MKPLRSLARPPAAGRSVPRLLFGSSSTHFTCQQRHSGLAARDIRPARFSAPPLALQPRFDAQAASTDAAAPAAVFEQPVAPAGWRPWLGRAVLLAALAAVALALAAPRALAGAASGASSAGFSPSQALKGLLSFVLHLDVHLAQIIARHGRTPTYAILWAIVFCETGLVITPFLPGDSLLFAAGAFAALGHLNLGALLAIFISSAILGDAVNYQLGKAFGARATGSKLVKQEYVDKTQAFYQQHGGKTVVLARFVPIVRTFAPFVAGVGAMDYGRFFAYNVGGAVLWSGLFVGAGALLGNLPAVKHNFSLAVFAIIAVSLLPVVFEVAAARREAGQKQPPAQPLQQPLQQPPRPPAQA